MHTEVPAVAGDQVRRSRRNSGGEKGDILTSEQHALGQLLRGNVGHDANGFQQLGQSS
jgi:hypothetical protein